MRLAAQGKPYRRNRVAFSMHRQGLRSKVRRKFVVTTDTKHDLKASPNLLNRSFDAGRPNEVWVSDITYLSSRSGWLYLVVFMKVFELGYPFLWKGRKSLACRRQAKRLSYRVQTTETHIDSGCAYFLVVSSPVFDFQG